MQLRVEFESTLRLMPFSGHLPRKNLKNGKHFSVFPFFVYIQLGLNPS